MVAQTPRVGEDSESPAVPDASARPDGRRLTGFVTGVSWTVCLVLAWVVAWVAIDPQRPFDHFHRGWAWLLGAVLVALLVLGARHLRGAVDWLEERTTLRRVAGAGLLGVAAVVMTRVSMAVRFPPTWDAGAVEDWAHGLAHGYLDADAYETMANRYPNNLALVGVLTRWFQLCDLAGITSAAAGVAVLNVLVLSAALAITWALARRVAGPTGGYVAMLLAVPLVVLSPWLGVAYSDTLCTVFPAGIVLLFLVARGTESTRVRLACWTGIGLLALTGYRLKPTVVFALMAVLAALVLEMRWGRDGRLGWRPASFRVGQALAAVVVGVLVAQAVLAVVVGRLGIMPEGAEKEQATPLTHFMMMGAHQGAIAWGGYNNDDVVFTNSLPPEQRTARTFEVYLDRVKEWGPVGYPVYLHEKVNWFMGDGNFNAFRHGQMNQPSPEWDFHDPVSESLRPWLTLQFEEFRWIALVRHAVWLGVLTLLAVPVLMRRREGERPARVHALEAAVLRVALLGLIVFLAFFEAGSRYIYLYVPVVLTLAALSVVELAERVPGSRGDRRARRGGQDREPAEAVVPPTT